VAPIFEFEALDMSNPIRAILCDIDGTLMFQGRAISGAARAVSDLRAAGLALRFLTNISSHPPERIANRLSNHGFDIRPEEIETSVTACASFLAADPESSVWLLVPDSVRHLFDHCRQDMENPDVVVVTDVRDGFSYAAMNEAFLKLSQGARFVVPHRNMCWFDDGARWLDAGAFIVGLETATGKKATVTGKPSAAFFNEALLKVGCLAGEALVVGDDVLTDIEGANGNGIRSVLVETGKGSDYHDSTVSSRPSFKLPSIASLPALVKFLNEGAPHAANLSF
jgi:HAD superfamily hydrolase (TIGR01458 family)